MDDFDEQIAEAALKIEAISLRPDNPFTWASGFRMPIYNDNRMHLRYPENRGVITDAFVNIITKNNLRVDFVTGTSTSGIAPAASLAQRLDVPLGITDGKVGDIYSPNWVKAILQDVFTGDYNIVVSTCPDSIIPGVFWANEQSLPFAYVREKPKTHGTQQQIESVVKEGDKVLFLDFHKKESYLERAIQAVKEKGARISRIISVQTSGGDLTFLRGQGLHVEDLVSTGGSCIDEIKFWRGSEAEIYNCLAIFSYDFGESLQRFAAADCRMHAALGYDKLLQVAVKTGYVKPEQQEMLAEWRADPFGWGEKHGFPKVER